MVIERSKSACEMMEESRVKLENKGDGSRTELRFTGKMMFKLLWDLEDARDAAL